MYSYNSLINDSKEIEIENKKYIVEDAKIKKGRNGKIYLIQFLHSIDNKCKLLMMFDNYGQMLAYSKYEIAKNYVHLISIKTNEKFKRNGLATIMINELKNIALENNCGFSLFCLNREDENGINLNYEFYKSFGFKNIDPDYYTPKSDIIPMEITNSELKMINKKEGYSKKTFDYFKNLK